MKCLEVHGFGRRPTLVLHYAIPVHLEQAAKDPLSQTSMNFFIVLILPYVCDNMLRCCRDTRSPIHRGKGYRSGQYDTSGKVRRLSFLTHWTTCSSFEWDKFKILRSFKFPIDSRRVEMRLWPRSSTRRALTLSICGGILFKLEFWDSDRIRTTSTSGQQRLLSAMALSSTPFLANRIRRWPLFLPSVEPYSSENANLFSLLMQTAISSTKSYTLQYWSKTRDHFLIQKTLSKHRFASWPNNPMTYPSRLLLAQIISWHTLLAFCLKKESLSYP